MTAPREIGIAVVGGGTMARAHAYGYAAAPVTWPLPAAPRLTVLCGRSAERTAQAARELGFADSTTDWRQAVGRPDVDIVDICTPPGAHAEVVAAAAAAGKAVICEKPLATTLADGRAAVAAVRASARPGCGGAAGCRTSSAIPARPSTGGSTGRSAAPRSPISAATWSTWPSG
jgi:predicted dehydrogenase